MPGPVILTAADRPGHHVLGRRFRSYCVYDRKPAVYVCDSHQSDYGYWMTREDAPEENRQDRDTKWRLNVSERAIGASFHRVWEDEE